MKPRNIASVSWGDHLVFGEGAGRLSTVEAVRDRMLHWRDELGAGTIHWRCTRNRIPGRYFAGRGYRHFSRSGAPDMDWDDFLVVPELAHDADMKAYLYVTVFDEGWPLLPKKVRERSYHNKMHCQHTSWQSDFSRKHPEYTMVDRSGRVRQVGVLCLAYPAVRRHFIKRFDGLLRNTEFDGLFLCLRSQSRPADHADQFGFNRPVRKEFRSRYGHEIGETKGDLQAWRDLTGGHLTLFLSELKDNLDTMGRSLALGVPRGSVLGPPMGNTTLDWRRWIRESTVDDLVINQDSSRCPSMWHDLWPMHRGTGYVQNYIDGSNMPGLLEDVDKNYGPEIDAGHTRLYVARQWDRRSASAEKRILSHPAVSGLVFSTFRSDNPGPVGRGDWSA